MYGKNVMNRVCHRIRIGVSWGTLYVAAVMAVSLLAGTGLVSEWGRWYSHDFAYHRQVEAFFHASLAVAQSPDQIQWDNTWSRNQVNLVWGLGVPALQLPFDVFSRVFGEPFFPDRLTFGIAFTLMCYSALRFCRSLCIELNGLQHYIEVIPSVLIVAMFPPFVTLCRTRFLVYEEAVAYAYFWGIGMAMWLIYFIKRPTFLQFNLLIFVSGLTVFVRPTLLAYVLAGLLIIWIYTARLNWSWWKRWMGIGFLSFAGALLFWTNFERFGSGFEFGHSLTLNSSAEMRYASRFDHPFRHEPLWSAGRELFSCLFVSGGKLNGMEWYQEQFFPWQSATFRWREMYFKVYDLSYLVVLGWVWCYSILVAIFHWRNRQKFGDLPYSAILGLWSLLSFLMLTAFYLRSPFISSRYLVDFAPSFAIAGVAFVDMIRRLALRYFDHRILPIRALVFVVITVWWAAEICTATIHPDFGTQLSFTKGQIEAEVAASKKRSDKSKALPRQYAIGTNAEEFGIPFNCAGWDMTNGATAAAISIFIRDPGRLELDVTAANGMSFPLSRYSEIHAKIGLESLEMARVQESPFGATLEFKCPQNLNYQKGIQAAFISFVDANRVSTNNSPFRLLAVRW